MPITAETPTRFAAVLLSFKTELTDDEVLKTNMLTVLQFLFQATPMVLNAGLVLGQPIDIKFATE